MWCIGARAIPDDGGEHERNTRKCAADRAGADGREHLCRYRRPARAGTPHPTLASPDRRRLFHYDALHTARAGRTARPARLRAGYLLGADHVDRARPHGAA